MMIINKLPKRGVARVT